MTLDPGIRRVRRSIHDHGLSGVTQLALAAMNDVLRPHDVHVWYTLELAGERPVVSLAEGFRLESPADLAPFDQLGPGGLSDARSRIAEGGVPWLILDDDRVAFACWILSHVPTGAARGGRLKLPDRMLCLEYSITQENYRGRGLAPAAWCAIADALQADGITALTTKVGVENVPSRRAVEKVGFREIATVSLRRRRLRLHADVAVSDAEASRFIVEGVRR